MWVDRQGRETPIPAPPRAYVYPRLSPDGTRIAVYAGDQEADIWVWDLGRTTLTRATFDPGLDIYPVWTPDGRRVIFSSERAGARNLFWQAADGTGAVERLTESPNQQNATAVSPDGRRLIFTETAPKTGEDVMQMDLDGTRRVTPLVQSPFAERNGVVSPDGRWLAYEANDSGRFEIWVRPFPEVNSGHWQVSTAGGTRPLWARSGQELFYVSPTGALMRVGVERAPVVGGHDADAAGQGRVLHDSGCQYRSHVRHLTGWTAVPDDQGGRRHGPDRRATQPHRRAALGRGAEAPRADELNGAATRQPPRPLRSHCPHWRRRHGAGVSGPRHEARVARWRSRSCRTRSRTTQIGWRGSSAKRKTLASLNHPNIAHIHGLEESGGVRALVMELVEGEDLSQRIARGPIPVDEALPIAKQIAEALEAAHEQGHHPPRPEAGQHQGAIRRCRQGARLRLSQGAGCAGHGGDRMSSQAPTITTPAMMTGVGMILGTAAYMSPEQARGKAVDSRTDIWAFGCVLFEMLTGKRPFDGEDITDVLGAVVRLEPDWTMLPPSVPPTVRSLLRRCLEKDRRKRISHISTALFAIDEAGALGPPARASSAAIAVRPIPLWRRLATYSAPALIAGLAVAGAVWVATRPVPPRVLRLAITTTPATALAINGVDRDLAITPDGSRVVYVGNNGRELFVRPLDALEPVSLFTGAPRAPFVSPDGQWVGFIGRHKRPEESGDRGRSTGHDRDA